MKRIPVADLAFRISRWYGAHLEPAVNPIRASKTGLDVKGLARFDRLCPSLDYARKILRMNHTDASPVLQLLICFAEILQFRAVEKRRLARCPDIHKPGNIVDNLPPGQFAGPQGFLSALAILDLGTGSVPFDDLLRFVSQWIGAKQEPAICTVKASHSRFHVKRLARSQARAPTFDQAVAVIRMDGCSPSPTLGLFRSHARVIEPYLVSEVAVAVRASSPCRRGDRVDDGGKIALAPL